MKMEMLPVFNGASASVVAEFGSARLIQASGERLELQGGSTQERAEAREWASLFLDAEYVAWRSAVAVA